MITSKYIATCLGSAKSSMYEFKHNPAINLALDTVYYLNLYIIYYVDLVYFGSPNVEMIPQTH